ncbi:MaoC family dehydratase [Rubrimonas cliftonensis]|uniref:Acyl dehydratase n=1 Tax=Rubrimonas cliftonensis TaxID=89524 RepID=A0A1H4FTH9_9RHOB|nr:MaoC family dehydratase [Rubrimonas cliftonensis]SEB00594.1 Acyl dehydratase [Rubrimonas cliftonensis]
MPQPENYSVNNLNDHIGHDFGTSNPIVVSQDMINAFADVTGDHQWIHVDVEKATHCGPFGGPVAHGFLTLSLLAASTESVGVAPSDAKAVVNYGLGGVRFPEPVRSGSTVRARYTLAHVETKAPGAQLMTLKAELKADGADKPAVVAELLAMVMG